MGYYADKTDMKIETVSFNVPMYNPRLRSEEEGLMACAFTADVTIDGESFFLDTAFVFKTPDFWAVGDVVFVNSFWCFEEAGENDRECQFSPEQQQQIISVLAPQMTYDTYSWFTKTITKPQAA